MWFALILVSLKHWKQLLEGWKTTTRVVICSHFSIFETLETTCTENANSDDRLWFALILVSLKHWKQPIESTNCARGVVICSHFSIFETLETTECGKCYECRKLWFALILVSLKHWKQHITKYMLKEDGCDLLSF